MGLEGSANGDWWLDSIGRTLDEGVTFQRVGSRQLAGLLIGAWYAFHSHFSYLILEIIKFGIFVETLKESTYRSKKRSLCLIYVRKQRVKCCKFLFS